MSGIAARFRGRLQWEPTPLALALVMARGSGVAFILFADSAKLQVVPPPFAALLVGVAGAYAAIAITLLHVMAIEIGCAVLRLKPRAVPIAAALAWSSVPCFVALAFDLAVMPLIGAETYGWSAALGPGTVMATLAIARLLTWTCAILTEVVLTYLFLAVALETRAWRAAGAHLVGLLAVAAGLLGFILVRSS